MIEKRYLNDVVSVAKSKRGSGIRLRLRVFVYFTLAASALVVLPTYIGLLGTNESLLLLGMLIGAMTMRLSTIYRFSYLVPHLNLESVQRRLDELDT